MRTVLHSLNNALAAAIGRLEICEDLTAEVEGAVHEDLSTCIAEAESALLRARGHVAQLSTLTAVPVVLGR